MHEIVWLYLFDTGNKIEQDELNKLFNNPEDFTSYEYKRPQPEEIPTITMPYVFNFKDEVINIKDKKIELKVQVAFYYFGVYSIRVRYQTEEFSIANIIDMTFNDEIKKAIEKIVIKSSKKVENQLSKLYKLNPKREKETYRFYFFLTRAKEFLNENKDFVAGLMIDEKEYKNLDKNYVDALLNKNIRYSEDSILLAGWESSVMIDTEPSHEIELILAEVTNAQFLVTRRTNSEINEIIQRVHLDIGSTFQNKSSILKRLHFELGSKLYEGHGLLNLMNNIVYGTGEWYLSRVYNLFASAVNLENEISSLEKNIEYLNEMRTFINEQLAMKREDMLEIIIIILFVVEILVETIYLMK